MTTTLRIFFAMLVVVFSLGCTKLFPDKTPSSNESSSGVLYINTVGQITKRDANTDSTYWISSLVNMANSAYNPLVFDSGFYYHGNHTGITCYNIQNGQPLWSFAWLAFDNAIPYREPAFKDSLVVFTAPTSVWDYAWLHCLKKKNGTLLWKIKIDSGNVYNNFNSTPVVYNNQVIVVTRNASDQLFLNAYSVTNATKLWSKPLKISTHAKLFLQNGRVYAAYGAVISCHDAASGQQIWETDLQQSSCWRTYSFIDNDKLVIEKIISNSDYKIFTINLITGSIIRNYDLKLTTSFAGNPQFLAPYGAAFASNTLFIGQYINSDSMEMYAFDINSMNQKWKQRFAHSIFGGQLPLATDKYLIFPINDTYNVAPFNQSKMIFLDFNGGLIKKLPFVSRETDVFAYKEGSVVYRQTPGL